LQVTAKYIGGKKENRSIFDAVIQQNFRGLLFTRSLCLCDREKREDSQLSEARESDEHLAGNDADLIVTQVTETHTNKQTIG